MKSLMFNSKSGWLKIGLLILAAVFICTAGAAWAASDSHGDAGHKGWVATDTYRVMNFAVLFIALFFILRKPVKQALNARITGIKDQLSDLEAKKSAAEAELAKYNQQIAELDKEAEQIMASYIQQGEDAKTRILKEAESAAQKLEDQARRNIDFEFQRAKEKLHADILEKALVQAENMVAEKISDQDQERLVDEYLEKVVA